MRILFIKLKNIGDMLIATPAYAAARAMFPDATIDVVVRPGTDKILQGAKHLVNTICTTSKANVKGWARMSEDLKLLGTLRANHYDWVFELSDNDRGRIMAAFTGAPNRAGHSRARFKWWSKGLLNRLSDHDFYSENRCNKDVELLRKFLGYTGETPAMVYDLAKADSKWVNEKFPAGEKIVVLNPFSGMRHKEWPAERWTELAKRLLSWGYPVLVASGPDPKEIEGVKAIAEAAGDTRVTWAEKGLFWSQLVGLGMRTVIMVTVDTGALHLAAACKVPLVALFGPTPDREWGPWKTTTEVVTPPGPMPANINDRKMTNITVEAVLESCEKLRERIAVAGK